MAGGVEKAGEANQKDHPEYIRNFNASDRDMTKFIIGAVSALDIPLTPKAEGLRSRSAYLAGLCDDDLQRERDEVLHCNVEKIRELAPFAECIKGSGYVCILGSEEKINDGKELFTEIRTLN